MNGIAVIDNSCVFCGLSVKGSYTIMITTGVGLLLAFIYLSNRRILGLNYMNPSQIKFHLAIS